MLAALLFSVPTAYSIARFRFGGALFSNFLLLLRTMPAIALVIPLYVLYSKLGMTNNYFGLILLYTVFYIPFAVWLMIGFIRDVPKEIEEAALIDGAGPCCRSLCLGWPWWLCLRSLPRGTSSSSPSS